MKEFPTLREYLVLYKDAESTVIELKKQYRIKYQREYNKRRKKKVRITLRLFEKEYEKIISAKSSYSKRSLNKFIVQLCLGYLNKQYLMHHPDEIRLVKNSISNIGSNINQIVHKLHLSLNQKNENDDTETLSRLLDGYENLKKEVDNLSEFLDRQFTSPPATILALEWNEIKFQKDKIEILLEYLNKHLESCNDH